MKNKKWAIFFLALIQLQGCGYTQLVSRRPERAVIKSERTDHSTVEFVVIPFPADTVPVSPNTRFFFIYNFRNIERWTVNPRWVLANLEHFGVKVREAWYHAALANTGGENGSPIGDTMTPPFLVVGLASDDIEILRHNFERERDPYTIQFLHKPTLRLVHYIPSEPR